MNRFRGNLFNSAHFSFRSFYCKHEAVTQAGSLQFQFISCASLASSFLWFALSLWVGIGSHSLHHDWENICREGLHVRGVKACEGVGSSSVSVSVFLSTL